MPAGLESASWYACNNEASVRQVMYSFEVWLRPLRCQYALGNGLADRQHQVKSGIWHVAAGERLLAVVDLERWRVGINPSARPVDFEFAHWDHRPLSASFVPHGYVDTALMAVMWTFASRTRADVLPKRYRSQTIYFRHSPRVPVGWMGHAHLLALSELAAKESTLLGLAERTQIPLERLAHVIAALYFSGSVTTDVSRRGSVEAERQLAGRGEKLDLTETKPPSPDLLLLAQIGDHMPEQDKSRDWARATVPAALR